MPMQMPRLFPDGRPVLGGSQIVSLVVPARDLAASRAFYEGVLGLPPVADDRRSVRADAGSVVLDLRPADPPAAAADGGGARLVLAAEDADALLSALAGCGVAFTAHADPASGVLADFADPDGHRLALSRRSPAGRARGVGAYGVAVAELVLPVRDAEAAAELFEEGLDLRPLGRAGDGARYDAGGVVLATLAAPDAGGGPRAGIAPVFHVEDLGDTVWQLAKRGIRLARTVTYSRTGGVARLEAPSGHLLWLWEPSDEARDGPGGRKLEEILSARA